MRAASVLALVFSCLPALAAEPATVSPDTARSAPTAPARKVAVLVAAQDAVAREHLERLSRAAEEALSQGGGLELFPLGDAFEPQDSRRREQKRLEAEAELEQGKRAYEELDTRAAQAQLDRAARLFEDTDLSRHFAKLVEARLMRAASLIANGDARGAQAQLDALVDLNPEVVLPPAFFPPESIAAADRARRSTQQRRLRVSTSPPGARIFLDGSFVGFAPLELEVRPGEHFVTASLQGHALAQARARGTAVALELAALPVPALGSALSALGQPSAPEARVRAAAKFGQDIGAEEVLLVVARKSPVKSALELWAARVDVAQARALGTGASEVGLGKAGEAGAARLFYGLATLEPQRTAAASFDGVGEDGSKRGWTQRHTGYALLGTGVALLGGAGVLFYQSNQKEVDAERLAFDDPARDPLLRRSKRLFFFADITALAGLAAGASGVYLAFLSPPEPPAEGPVPSPPAPVAMPAPAPAPPPEEKKAPLDEDLRDN